MATHGNFFWRLEAVEIQTESADIVESITPEQALVDRPRLGPDGPVIALSVIHRAPQQLACDTQTPVQRVRDNGVDDESVTWRMLNLAMARSVVQLGGEAIAGVVYVAT